MVRIQTLRADKYSLTPSEISIGTRGSYGEEILMFEFSPEWEGLTKKAVFYPVRGKAVAVLISGDGIYVPHEITRISGQAKLIVAGSFIGDGTNPRKIITEPVVMNVCSTYDDNGASAEKVTPDLYDQFLEDAGKVMSDKIKEAIADGDFKGEQGEPGITPHIGENDNWFIGDSDTGKTSRGIQGVKGDSGVFVKTTASSTPKDEDTVMIDLTIAGDEISVPDGLYLNGRTLVLRCGDENVGNPVVLPSGGGESGGGVDGYSPTVSFTDIAGGRRMTVTDVNGAHTTDIMDGTNGVDGTNGTNGTDGRGIVSIERTSGTGAAGSTDTYTITYTDNTTSTFTVVNGANGTGADITIDTAMSDTSVNPVQNKVIKAYVDGLIGDIDTAIASINAVIGGN